MLRALVAAALSLTAALTTTAVAVPTTAARASQIDFYAVPDPLPVAKPGSVIRVARIAGPDGAKAWRVLYHSRTVAGRDIAVSGVIVAPNGKLPRGGRPIVSWAHGTTGIADLCAPSKLPTIASTLPYIDELIDAGYVVAATDYEGLGTPGVHPYLVGDSEGRGVLDAARAARRVDGTGAGRELLVFGHSQGGHAALFAGELRESYAPELRLRGVVAAAPPADLEVILPAASAVRQAAGFMIMASKGFQAAYPEADPATVLTPEAVAASSIADEACVGAVVGEFAGTSTTIVARNPGETPPWPELFRASTAGYRFAGAPLLVVQGGADRLVLQPLTDAWVAKACAFGDVVDYRVYDGADHGTVIGAAREDVLSFFETHANRGAATDTCPLDMP